MAIKNGRVKIQAEIADMKSKLDLAKRTTLKFREEIKKAQKEKGVEQTMFWWVFNQYFDVKPLPRSVPVPQFQRKTNKPKKNWTTRYFREKLLLLHKFLDLTWQYGKRGAKSSGRGCKGGASEVEGTTAWRSRSRRGTVKQESLCSQCTSQVWKKHVQDQETLDKYSESMKLLATSYWESSGEESRVQWVKSKVPKDNRKAYILWCFVSGGKLFLERWCRKRRKKRPEKVMEVQREHWRRGGKWKSHCIWRLQSGGWNIGWRKRKRWRKVFFEGAWCWVLLQPFRWTWRLAGEDYTTMLLIESWKSFSGRFCCSCLILDLTGSASWHCPRHTQVSHPLTQPLAQPFLGQVELIPAVMVLLEGCVGYIVRTVNPSLAKGDITA